ncbi:MAG: efflux RND transporter periplasmic adaptor subunit [Halioglobus sp.]|nr:efflux RND transporter periplasmic adaptor subunit [Halioglobus sp.]
MNQLELNIMYPSSIFGTWPRRLRRPFTLVVFVLLLPFLAACQQEGETPSAARHDEAGAEEHGEQEQAPHEEPADGQAREIHLTPEQHGLLNIEIANSPRGHADALLSAPAVVRFDPDRVARIGPRLEAKVVQVLVDLGDVVESGDVLAVLASVQLGRTRARYLTASALLENARAEFERERRLAEQQIASEAELLDARAALREAEADQQAAMEALRLFGLSSEEIDSTEPGKALSRLSLTASMDGVVQRRDLSPGQTLGPDDTPIHIVDNSRMWLMIDAFENSLDRIRLGQDVEFTSRVLNDARFSGQIDWISRELDEQSRTVTLRAVLENPRGILRAGLFGTARIDTGSGEGPPRVPIDAVQRLGETDVVFVPAEEEYAFRAVPVTLSHEGNGWVEVVEGIVAGEPVVFEGAFDLMSALTAASRSAEHSH